MKRILTLAVCLLMIAALFVPVSAAEAKIVYSQDFSSVKSFDELGWTKNEVFTPNTATYTIADGKLIVDNINDAAKDSYVIMVPASTMASVIKDDYTVQYDITLLDASASDRYLCVLVNYDRELGNSYTSCHIRMRGTGNWETRTTGSWTTIDGNGEVGGFPIANSDNTIGMRVFGDTSYDSAAYALQNKKMTVRQEFYKDGSSKIYINDVLITGTDKDSIPQFQLNTNFSEIALKAGGKVKAEFDNFTVATGIGIPKPVVTTAKAAAAAADGAAAAAKPAAAAQTFDAAIIALIPAALSAAALVVIRKRK